MLRRRLLWFTIGFSVSSAAIGHFMWRDLLAERYALSTQTKQSFDALESRVLNLESISSNPAKVINDEQLGEHVVAQ